MAESSYRVTPASVGITPRNNNPFTADLSSGENNSIISEDYEKVFNDESIQGGITAKTGKGGSSTDVSISKDLQLLETDKLNVSGNIRGGAFSNNTTMDGTIYNESGKRLGASIGGTLILNASGSNWLTGSIGKDYSKVNLEEITENSQFKDSKGETYTEYAVGINVGRFGANLPKGEINYMLMQNGTIQLFANPESVGIRGGIEFNKGGTPMMNKQMEMFEDGGLKDEGGMIDKESGNDVPVGSTRKEVRDDIPAQLSEGEFVFPADVVRYIGLEKLMGIRQKAKMGLQRMEDMGQMGNSDEATMPDDMPFDETDLIIIDGDKEVEMAKGGVLMAAEGTDVKKRYTFDQLMGQNKLSFRIYKNKDGVGTTIRFVGDSPVDPIPKGFYPIDEAGNPVIPETDTSDTDSDTTDTDTGDTDTTETPEYGGDFDALGMVPGSVGSVQSLNMGLANQLDLIAGKEPTFIEKLFSKFGVVKTLKALDKKIMGDDTTGTALNRAVDSLNTMIDNGEENSTEFNKLAGSFVDASKGYLGDTDGDGIIDINEDVDQIIDQELGFGDTTGSNKTFAPADISKSDKRSGGLDAEGGGPDGSPDAAGGGFSGPSGSGSGSGGVSGDDFGMFNQGGLAGKKPKSKKKQYKKGGLATSKK